MITLWLVVLFGVDGSVGWALVASGRSTDAPLANAPIPWPSLQSMRGTPLASTVTLERRMVRAWPEVGNGCIRVLPMVKMSDTWLGVVLAAWAVRAPRGEATVDTLRLAIR